MVGKNRSAAWDFSDHVVSLLSLINEEADIPEILGEFHNITQQVNLGTRRACISG